MNQSLLSPLDQAVSCAHGVTFCILPPLVGLERQPFFLTKVIHVLQRNTVSNVRTLPIFPWPVLAYEIFEVSYRVDPGLEAFYDSPFDFARRFTKKCAPVLPRLQNQAGAHRPQGGLPLNWFVCAKTSRTSCNSERNP